MHATTAQSTPASGPLHFPPPPTTDSARALDALKGHTTSDAWLPAEVWPALDSARDKHLHLRSQVAADLDALRSLTRRNRQEDVDHQEALREAYRRDAPPPPDDRTTSEQRATERASIEERLWARVVVWAEHVETIIETTREHERDWLGGLQGDAAVAQDKRFEAARLLAEADAEEYYIAMLGRWLQTTNDDDGGFGRQPAPAPGTPAPVRLDRQVLKDALERPWHKLRSWNRSTMTDGAAGTPERTA